MSLYIPSRCELPPSNNYCFCRSEYTVQLVLLQLHTTIRRYLEDVTQRAWRLLLTTSRLPDRLTGRVPLPLDILSISLSSVNLRDAALCIFFILPLLALLVPSSRDYVHTHTHLSTHSSPCLTTAPRKSINHCIACVSHDNMRRTF